MMPRPIIDMGKRASAPDAQNAFVPEMENSIAYGERLGSMVVSAVVSGV